jgi:hypothetical protein
LTVTTYKFAITAAKLITKFANMKGTIYGNVLPRGHASEKRLGTADLKDT